MKFTNLLIISTSFVFAALSGCSSTATNSDTATALRPRSSLVVDTITSDTSAELIGSAQVQEFSTQETIDGTAYGLIGDGSTDNTATFRKLMSVTGRKITINAGTYVTGSFSIPDNTELVLMPGTVIKDLGHLGSDERLISIRSNNVKIIGYGARVVSDRTFYTGGEQRHGIFIFGATNVTIEGLASESHSGDGFYIGGPTLHPSMDIVLLSCNASNNRRQGLSITSARRVDIVDIETTRTAGTSPQFGIDIEPNLESNFIDQITLVRPRTGNNEGGGIMVYLAKLTSASPPVSVKVLSHLSMNEKSFVVAGDAGVIGTISYSESDVKNQCAGNNSCIAKSFINP